MMKFFADKKAIVILLLSALTLIKSAQESFAFLLASVITVFTCAAADILINRIFFKKRISANSAIISGLIIAGVTDYRLPWHTLILLAGTAIASKYLIRYKHRHIFNPAGFAIFIAILLKVPLLWNIESNIPLIIIAGIYLAYAFKKLFHVVGFLIIFSLGFFILGERPFSLISWFFLFIMLIEPKTSGYGRLKGFTFGGIAAFLSCLFYKFLPGYDFFISPLLIANASLIFLDKIKVGEV